LVKLTNRFLFCRAVMQLLLVWQATTFSTATTGRGARHSQQQCQAPAHKPLQQHPAQLLSYLTPLQLLVRGCVSLPAGRPVSCSSNSTLLLLQLPQHRPVQQKLQGQGQLLMGLKLIVKI
jgi:hypothetical protein